MKTALLIITLLAGTSFSSFAKSGSNIGGGNIGSEYLALWCKDQSSLLRKTRDRAVLKLDSSNQYSIANKILRDGIVQALNNSENQAGSFLHNSLTRGLTIADQLSITLDGNEERKSRVIYNILINYYDFMIETVAKHLELNAHVPYLNSPQEELDQAASHFEENFVHYASFQLNWMLQTLVRETNIGGKIDVTPVGNTKSVLKVAITLSRGIADDLENSLWNYRFSCSITELRSLASELEAYDQGNKEIYESERQAITYMTNELLRLSRVLEKKESCL